MKFINWFKGYSFAFLLVFSVSFASAAESCQEQTYAMHITHNLIKSIFGNPNAEFFTIEQEGHFIFDPCKNSGRSDLTEIFVEGAILKANFSISSYPNKSFLRADLSMRIQDSDIPISGEGVTIKDPLNHNVVIPTFCLYATSDVDDYGYGVETCFSNFRKME